MKDHHTYEMAYLGESDVSALTVTTFGADGLTSHILRFGMDGEYKAYIVDAECEIPAHYENVLHIEPYQVTFFDGTLGAPSGWVRVYDDEALTYKADFHNGLNIYRAGDLGCIVQLL